MLSSQVSQQIFQGELHVEGHLDARFILKLKSPTASFTKCWAGTEKGGISCPFNGGGMPYSGKLPSYLFIGLMSFMRTHVCLHQKDRTNHQSTEDKKERPPPQVAGCSLRYIRCP